MKLTRHLIITAFLGAALLAAVAPAHAQLGLDISIGKGKSDKGKSDKGNADKSKSDKGNSNGQKSNNAGGNSNSGSNGNGNSNSGGLGVGLSIGDSVSVGVSVGPGNSGNNSNAGGNGNGLALGLEIGNGNQGETPGNGNDNAELDLEQALKAVEDERALPLGRVLSIARNYTSGRIIDVHLVTVDSFLLYELKSLENDGEVSLWYFYASSGAPVRRR
ncbi:PepSY domain-containing protein [Cucumibacter marinus]|uniref:PepSY domain-containing protein n=1 Tax=Cucumibacter marinus TaxID=1121252 RepID=UPI0012DC81DC|nr:hypothetical protein [Cucumibacter marinus]